MQLESFSSPVVVVVVVIAQRRNFLWLQAPEVILYLPSHHREEKRENVVCKAKQTNNPSPAHISNIHSNPSFFIFTIHACMHPLFFIFKKNKTINV